MIAQERPDADIVLILVKDPVYGGGGGQFATASINLLSREVADHEIGHSFGSLADEYEDPFPEFVQVERANANALTNRETLRWKS